MPKISTVAYKHFYFYLLGFFFVPMVAHVFYQEEFKAIYRNMDHYWPILVILFLLFLIPVCDRLLPKVSFPRIKGNPFVLILSSRSINLYLSVIFFIASIYFFHKFSIAFRHKETISGGGGIIILLFSIHVYFKVFILFNLIKSLHDIKKVQLDYLTYFILILSFLLFLNSSWDAIYIFIILLLFINKEKAIFTESKLTSVNSLLVKYSKPLIFALVIVLVIFIGYANKVGVDNTYDLFSQLETLLLKVIKRLSMWYASTITAAVNYFENPEIGWTSFWGTIQNAIYRFGIIFNYTFEQPEIWSVNRHNFLLLFQENTNSRTGASPGIFASIFYLPLFPLNIFLIIVYIIFILRQFSDFFMSINYKLSAVGLLLLAFFLMPLFEGPLNYLNIADKGLIYFLFFISIKPAMKKYLY